MRWALALGACLCLALPACEADEASADAVAGGTSGNTDGTDPTAGVDGTGAGTTTWSAAQAVYEQVCTPCHKESAAGCSGNVCFVSSYAEATKDSVVCPGETVAACTVARVKNGAMPLSTTTVSDEQLGVLEAWVAGGAAE